MPSRSTQLVAVLDEFVNSSHEVEAAAVVSFDGLPMASALPDHMEEDRLGAMAAALLSLGEQAAAGLGRGSLSQVFVEGADGYVFLMSARGQAVLACITSHDAKIGLMLYQMRQTADAVGRALGPADDRRGGGRRVVPTGLDPGPAGVDAAPARVDAVAAADDLRLPGPPDGPQPAPTSGSTVAAEAGYGDVASLTS